MGRARGLQARIAGGLIAAVIVAGGLGGAPAAAQEDGTRTYVFGAEGNRLNAYDVTDPDVLPAPKQTLRPNHDDDPVNGLDINAQICFFPDGSHRFVAGEDTNQPNPPPGWGIFQLEGDAIGSFSITQIGKLTPTYQDITDPATSVPDNYGCGFLSDGRIVTSDIGNNLPGFEGNGQLIVWFPPFDVFDTVSDGDTLDNHCILDVGIATAGGIHVDDQDRVYVASNRPDTTPPVLSSGGVYRYSGSIPSSPAECSAIDPATGLAPGITKELFIPESPFVLTPSAIAPSGHGTYYVSSVFSGTIAEFDADGGFVRMILTPPPGELPPFSTGTPFGLSVDSDGTLYYADLGVGSGPPPGPVDGEGSEFRIRFVNGEPEAPDLIDAGQLNYPDGSGVLEITPPQALAPTPTAPGCPAAASASLTSALPTGGPAIAGVAPLGLGALRQRRRVRRAGRNDSAGRSGRARARSAITWLMVAGVAVAVLAACRPVKPPVVPGC